MDARGEVRRLKVLTSTFAETLPPEYCERFTGIVVPHRASALAAKAVGRVERVLVDIGDTVEEGQLLIQLDEQQLLAERRVAEAELAVAQNRLEELETGPRRQELDRAQSRVAEIQANLDLAAANLKRAQGLRDSGAISKQEFDEQRYAVDALDSQLKAAQQQLDLLEEGTRREMLAAQRNLIRSLEAGIERIRVRLAEQQVRAPYAGQVQTRLVDEGDVVQPAQTLLQIVESSVLEVEVGLPVKLANRLQPDWADLVVEDDRGKSVKLPAEIARMAPSLDSSTRTRKCVFRLHPQQGHPVVIGDAVSVCIRVPLEPAAKGSMWVPTTALTTGPRGLWSVYVLVAPGVENHANLAPPNSAGGATRDAAESKPSSDGKAGAETEWLVEQRPVELLRAYGDWSEVRGPLQFEERFITEGVHRIVRGQIVVAVSKVPTGRSGPISPGASL